MSPDKLQWEETGVLCDHSPQDLSSQENKPEAAWGPGDASVEVRRRNVHSPGTPLSLPPRQASRTPEI